VSWAYVTPKPKPRIIAPDTDDEFDSFDSTEPSVQVRRAGPAILAMLIAGMVLGAGLTVFGAISIWLGQSQW